MHNKPRTALGTAAALVLVFQVVTVWRLENGPTELLDRDLADKISRLRELDGCGIWFLGSSRVLQGVQADIMDDVCHRAKGFNLGMTATGPVRQYVIYRKLRAYRPALVLFEVMPEMLNAPGRNRLSEELWIRPISLSGRDLWHLRHWHSEPGRLLRDWATDRLSAVRRVWGERPPAVSAWPAPMDARGYQPFPAADVDDAYRSFCFAHAIREYTPALADFRPSVAGTEALFALVRECRRQGTRAVPVALPEGTALRQLASGRAADYVSQLLVNLQSAGAEPAIDARDWLDDRDFWDGHHMLPRGASKFSSQIAAELRRRESLRWR